MAAVAAEPGRGGLRRRCEPGPTAWRQQRGVSLICFFIPPVSCSLIGGKISKIKKPPKVKRAC